MNNRRLILRTGVVILIMISALFAFGLKLYDLQIIEGESYYLQGKTVSSTVTIAAARGSILDRYGRVLVSNREGYNITINRYTLFNTGRTNEIVTQLIALCDEMGIEHIDTLPINEDGTAYLFEELGATYENYFRQYMTYLKWDRDITAENIYKLMRDYYNIGDDVSDADARGLIGVRYELTLRNAVGMDDYILAEDVSLEDATAIIEQNFPGVSLSIVTYREYNTKYAAHLLGSTGLMTANEYEYYKTLDYPMDAIVGKDGVESAFEELLHGTDGKMVISTDEAGRIVEQYILEEAQPGQNVYLTIDSVMQELAERSLESCILSLRAGTGEGSDARGGAVVVMDVNTFEVLAIASYPSFDLANFSAIFNDLNEDEYLPMWDRSLLAPYSPGSVFKMVSATAALDDGLITPLWELEDKGRYMRYEDKDYTPVCNYFKNTGLTHGSINVMQALSVSCNYFFYEMGYMVGLDRLQTYAQSFGLGEETGFEVYNEVGTRAGGDDRREWWSADTLSAAIGQSENKFTPLQMCTYICTLANGGTRYNTHLLSKAVSNDYQYVTQVPEQVLMSEAMMSDTAYKTVKDGMLLTSRSSSGSGFNTFGKYEIDVCSKTGTVEHGEAGSDHASFACFAPYDDPEIAVFVYVENGARGGSIAPVAKDILDYYFGSDEISGQYYNENTLLR